MTTASATVRPGPATYFPKKMMRRLSRAALVIFDEVIWEATHFGERPERISDRFIASKTGYAIRTVQAAIHDLCNAVAAVVDGVEVMLLGRSFRYGPREECGRELRVTAPQVVPVEKAREEPGAQKPKAKRAGPPSNPIPPPVVTPEDLAAAARPPEVAITPEDEALARSLFGRARERNAARQKMVDAAKSASPDGKVSRADTVRIERALERAFGLLKPEPKADPDGSPPMPSGP